MGLRAYTTKNSLLLAESTDGAAYARHGFIHTNTRTKRRFLYIDNPD